MTLVSLLAAFAAVLVEGQTPQTPAGGTDGGLSDEALWSALSAPDGDVLGGMDFVTAVRQDPRRVVALIEQRVVADFYRALSYCSGRSEEVIRHLWLSGYHTLRQERGRVDIQGIRDLWLLTRAQEMRQVEGREEAQPPNYQRLLDAGVAMARPNTPACQFWGVVGTQADTLRRLFSESRQIAERASLVALAPEDTEAWQQIGAVLEDMEAGLFDHLAQFTANPPQARAPRERTGSLGVSAPPCPTCRDRRRRFGAFGTYEARA